MGFEGEWRERKRGGFWSEREIVKERGSEEESSGHSLLLFFLDYKSFKLFTTTNCFFFGKRLW